MSTLNVCTPHYIRCIKANSKKQGDLFMGGMILEQLRYSGVFEAVSKKSKSKAVSNVVQTMSNNDFIIVCTILDCNYRKNNFDPSISLLLVSL